MNDDKLTFGQGVIGIILVLICFVFIIAIIALCFGAIFGAIGGVFYAIWSLIQWLIPITFWQFLGVIIIICLAIYFIRKKL